MTTVTVEIKNQNAFKILEGMEDAKLIKLRIPFKASKEKTGILNGIGSALKEVELHEKGKIKLQSAKNFFNEI